MKVESIRTQSVPERAFVTAATKNAVVASAGHFADDSAGSAEAPGKSIALVWPEAINAARLGWQQTPARTTTRDAATTYGRDHADAEIIKTIMTASVYAESAGISLATTNRSSADQGTTVLESSAKPCDRMRRIPFQKARELPTPQPNGRARPFC